MEHDEAVELRLAELLADRPAEVGELAMATRRVVAKWAKGASELLYQTYAVSNVFTYSDRLKEAFIHIATYANHVNLGFNQGAILDDPDGLLEGGGKLIRHIRIESASTLQKRSVKDLMKNAIKMGNEMAEKANRIRSQRFIDKS